MRSHKHAKQHFIAKKGFLRKRIAGQEPSAGDGWSSETIAAQTDHCNEMGGYLDVISKGEDRLKDKVLHPVDFPSKLCPLAQDEIAISDAAEVGGTIGKLDFRPSNANTAQISPLFGRPSSETVCTKTTDVAYASTLSEEKKDFIVSLGELSLKTNANVSKNDGDYSSHESTTIPLSPTSGCCHLMKSSADASELRTASSISELLAMNTSGDAVIGALEQEQMDNVQQGRAPVKSEGAANHISKQLIISGGINHLVEEILGKLYQPFDRVRGILVRQARDILVCNYSGNLEKFLEEFLQPAADLLRNFKAKERGLSSLV